MAALHSSLLAADRARRIPASDTAERCARDSTPRCALPSLSELRGSARRHGGVCKPIGRRRRPKLPPTQSVCSPTHPHPPRLRTVPVCARWIENYWRDGRYTTRTLPMEEIRNHAFHPALNGFLEVSLAARPVALQRAGDRRERRRPRWPAAVERSAYPRDVGRVRARVPAGTHGRVVSDVSNSLSLGGLVLGKKRKHLPCRYQGSNNTVVQHSWSQVENPRFRLLTSLPLGLSPNTHVHTHARTHAWARGFAHQDCRSRMLVAVHCSPSGTRRRACNSNGAAVRHLLQREQCAQGLMNAITACGELSTVFGAPTVLRQCSDL